MRIESHCSRVQQLYSWWRWEYYRSENVESGRADGDGRRRRRRQRMDGTHKMSFPMVKIYDLTLEDARREEGRKE